MTLDLEPIEKRAAAATKGPWEARRTPDKFDSEGKLVDPAVTHLWHIVGPPAPGDKANSHICGMGGFSDQHGANAAFAAAARDDVPALIGRIRELEAEIARSSLARSSELIALSVSLQGAPKCKCYRFATCSGLSHTYDSLCCDTCRPEDVHVYPDLPQAKLARRFRALFEESP